MLKSQKKYLLVWISCLLIPGTVFAQDTQSELEVLEFKDSSDSAADLSESPSENSGIDSETSLVTPSTPTVVEEEKSEMEELDDRLYDIEKSLAGKFPVLPIDADRIRIGGFLTSTYSQLFNSTNSEGSFNSNRFEILLGADLTKKLDFFTAFGIISESELLAEGTSRRSFGNNNLPAGVQKNRANKVPLIISHGTYRIHDLLAVKFGRFIAPVGIINIEHFPPGLFLEIPPMSLRPVPGGLIWGNFLNGLDFFGQKAVDSQTIGYHLNVSTFSFLGPQNSVSGGAAPGGDSTQPIYGGRLWVRFFQNRITLGLSMQSGLGGVENQTYGSDLLVDWGRFLLKTEWTSRVVRENGVVTNRRFIYFQPSVRLNNSLRAVYRFDWSDTEGPVPVRTEHIVGLNWVPTPLLRLRAEYSLIDFQNELDTFNQNPDYGRLTVSGVISF